MDRLTKEKQGLWEKTSLYGGVVRSAHRDFELVKPGENFQRGNELGMEFNLLSRISSFMYSTTDDVDRRVFGLLDIVRDELDFAYAVVYVLDEEQLKVRWATSNNGSSSYDQIVPLHGSIAERILSSADNLVTLTNTLSSPQGHPVYGHTTPAFITGAKLYIGGHVRGIVEFSSAFRKDTTLGSAELALVKLVAGALSDIISTQTCLLESDQDRSESKETKEALYDAEDRYHQLEQLVRNVAHEYNNVLVAIMGSSDLALQDVPENSDIQRRLMLIQRSAQRAADLTDRLSSFSGELEPEMTPLNLSTIIREAIAQAKASIKSGVRLDFQDAHVLPQINADEKQLRKLINGLIRNALHSVEPKGEGIISIFTGILRVEKDYANQCKGASNFGVGDYLFIKITDTGVGLSREVVQRVFDPAFSSKISTHGMPMSDVLKIVSAHGGAVDFNSSSGVGSTVKVLFPLVKTEGAAQPSQPLWEGQACEPGEVTVLVVDDEENVCVIAEEILRKSGYRTLQARNGAEAIETFRSYMEDISLAILDLTMPDMTGIEVCEKLRAIRGDIPVIISSGYQRSAVLAEFGGRPLMDFVHKPFSQTELVDRVRAATHKKQT